MILMCSWFLSLTALALALTSSGLKLSNNGVRNASFAYQDINQCKRNEFYDLDYFECIACNAEDADLQPTENKLACECMVNEATIGFYDINKEQAICATYIHKCNETPTTAPLTTNPNDEISTNCHSLGTTCPLKYVNKTSNDELNQFSKLEQLKAGKSLAQITQFKLLANNVTTSAVACHCDLVYNFRYQDYCIANELLKPYLHYNSYWQTVGGSSSTSHFGDLKFVAFFCLRLHNATACQQLANLCVMSHYSLDKNSPCSTFLLTQASDVVIRYATGMDEQLRTLRPFLFFKKGKQMAQQLTEAVPESQGYSLGVGKANNQLQIFGLNFALDGSLQRRGAFQLAHVNFCGIVASQLNFHFGTVSEHVKCALSLENLIDLASAKMQRDFLSLYLNFTKTTKPHKIFVQPIPVLIENLSLENQRHQTADWLLVRRFQMISAQPRTHYGPLKPIYDDAHKLQQFRSIRFVDRFEFNYKVFAGNRISVPLIRLRYKNIEIHANSTLNQNYEFEMKVTFSRAEADKPNSRRDIINETFLPLLLLMVITISILRAHNHRKRRRTTILTGATSTPQTVPVEFCDFRAILEFLCQLCTNAANALLICFLLHVMYDATKFLTQKELSITLPLIKDEHNATTLNILIYAALCSKFVFYCFHLWQASHVDIFFIDWERPKSYDNNHFNLKSNLETSSVCSSVRTFITENNVSAWRIFFVANEWIRLSVKWKTSIVVQCLGLLAFYKLFNIEQLVHADLILRIYFLVLIYWSVYILQHLCRIIFINRFNGNSLQKFIDLCSWANISVFVLLESSYGFYIHGRSPHGFAETDMSSMIMQLQRESQSMCGRRGLLSDSDQQTYIILPPANLRTFFQRLLVPLLPLPISAVGGGGVDGNLERTFIAYSSVNRFFCAFIDHAIKDMDYIIKEMTVLERFLNCEFENYLTENKGTFYIDKANAFSQLFLYGNEFHTFIMEIILLISIFMLFESLVLTSVVVCSFNMLTQWIYSRWTRRNISKKTLIDKRFLI